MHINMYNIKSSELTFTWQEKVVIDLSNDIFSIS